MIATLAERAAAAALADGTLRTWIAAPNWIKVPKLTQVGVDTEGVTHRLNSSCWSVPGRALDDVTSPLDAVYNGRVCGMCQVPACTC
jgi:hypothetical protein